MTTITLESLVPFGKYRGRTFAELMADTDYVNWMTSQAGIVERYPDIIKALQHGTSPAENSCTPEHNKMQMLFLDNSYIKGLHKLVKGKGPTHDGLSSGRVAYLQRELKDVERDYKYNPIVGAQEKARLTASIQLLTDCNQSLAEIFSTPSVVFERGNWDLVSDSSICYRCPSCKIYTDTTLKAFIELKPSMSDDYPAILRKVLQRNVFDGRGFSVPLEHAEFVGQKIVIVREFNSKIAAFEDVRKMFNMSRIWLLLLAEVESAAGILPEWLRGAA